MLYLGGERPTPGPSLKGGRKQGELGAPQTPAGGYSCTSSLSGEAWRDPPPAPPFREGRLYNRDRGPGDTSEPLQGRTPAPPD
jgi:hypothetical protein